VSTATAALVSIAGGLGALLRVLVGRAVVLGTGLPLAAGTWVVNVSGAFALGLVAGFAPTGDATLILGAGVLGGYTTFSTWMYESQRFAGEDRPWAAAVNLAASASVGLLAVWAGRLLAGG
jgi:fluoride exporter